MARQQSKIKELVYIGIYTAIYFLVVCISTGVLKLTVPIFNSIMIPALNALLAGVIYLTVLDRVPRFGALTTIGIVMGIFFLITGHFPIAFVPELIFSLLADWLQHGNRSGKVRLYLSYTIFSFGLTGPILPLWFMKQAYINELVSRGKDQAYINHVFAAVTNVSFVISMGSIVVCSILGMWIAQKIYDKHLAGLRGTRS